MACAVGVSIGPPGECAPQKRSPVGSGVLCAAVLFCGPQKRRTAGSGPVLEQPPGLAEACFGGASPQVRAAGVVDVRGGRIFSVNNASGHFNPGPGAVEAAKEASASFRVARFTRDFRGTFRFTTNRKMEHLGKSGLYQWLPGWVTEPGPSHRLSGQGPTELTPWYLMSGPEMADQLTGLQRRYRDRGLRPFAGRQDCDDVRCWEKSHAAGVAVIHGFASSGHEQRQRYAAFWDWFRSATEDMTKLEP